MNGISLSSLHRHRVRDGCHPLFLRKPPPDDFLFQKRQQAENWTDQMNTQDQHQKMHIPLGDGDDTNSEILDQHQQV